MDARLAHRLDKLRRELGRDRRVLVRIDGRLRRLVHSKTS
jgi:hypothetical protein